VAEYIDWYNHPASSRRARPRPTSRRRAPPRRSPGPGTVLNFQLKTSLQNPGLDVVSRPSPCSHGSSRAQSGSGSSRPTAHRIRSLLREYYPSIVRAFPNRALATPVARALLNAAPSSSKAARLAKSQIRRILLRAGRTRTSRLPSTVSTRSSGNPV
jgi:hypothetical protein